MIQKLIVASSAIFIFTSCVVMAVRYEMASMLQKEKELWRLQVEEPFQGVKNGRSSVLISNLALLEMLASDADCAKNLVSITFSSVTFQTSDGPKLAQLKNLESIEFYCCKNADSVIENCVEPQIHTIALDTTPISQGSIDALRKASLIDVMMNGHFIREE